MLKPHTTQQIADIIADAVPFRPFRAVIVDIAIQHGGTLEYQGLVIHSDYKTSPIDLKHCLKHLQMHLLQQIWPVKQSTGDAFNKAQFILDYGTWKLSYCLGYDEDYQWLQSCPPNRSPRHKTISKEDQRQIASWMGLPEDHPRPWLTRSQTTRR